MLFTDYLLEGSKDIWEKYLNHPFITEMGDGILDKEKFRKYLIQDYLYLIEYAKSYAMGCIKSRNLYEFKKFSNGMTGCIECENANHIMYLKDFKENIEKLEFDYEMNLENESYTSYMKSISLTGGIEEIIAVLLPCTWSYSYIGLFLKEKYSVEDNFYGSWIDAYSGEEYSKLTEEWINFTNETCKDLSIEKKEKLKDIFRKASLYELEFWNMAYKGE